MLSASIVFIVITVGMVVWLSILSVLLIRTISHYNRLTKGVTKAELTEVLNTIVTLLRSLEKRSGSAEAAIHALTKDGAGHFQRIGIVRFNPFADTGGAQSFSIALLNDSNSGIVMTSLYARAGNRWYVKEVVAGKPSGLELSKEEAKAIEQAVVPGTTV